MADPLRYHKGFAWLSRLPRPLLRWIAAAATLWHMLLSDVLERPSELAVRITVFGFVATIYGIRAVEKTVGENA